MSSRRVDFIRAFLASALGTGLSRVLGAARDIAIASFLGAGTASDAFIIAFTIPNVFRRFVADEGLTGAMVPALARAENEAGPDEARRLGAAVLGALLIANAALCILGVVFARPLVIAFAPTWLDDPEKLDLATQMARAMFPFVAMVSLVSWAEGMLNFRGHFFIPKVAPGMVSAGVVAAILLLGPDMEEPAWALVIGVLVGGVVHVLINGPPLFLRWGVIGIRFVLDERMRAVMVEISKVIAIGVFAQINLIVLRQIATSLPTGSVTHYNNGTRVVDLAQGIVAVAIGSALLPNLAQAVHGADWDRFRDDLVGALRLAAFMLLPVAIGLAAFAEPISALLFRLGAYSWQDAQATATAVRFLVPFVLALGGVNIIKRVFFALDDRWTLLWVGALGVALTAGLGWSLVGPLGVGGISLALSIATSTQLCLYLFVLRRRLGRTVPVEDLVAPFLRMALAAVPCAVLLVALAPLGEWTEGPKSWVNWSVFAVASGGSLALYLGASHLLGIPEVARLTGALRRRVGR